MENRQRSRFVFLDWRWSGQSTASLQILRSEPAFPPIEVVRPDEDQAFGRWLTDECERTGLPLHGCGHGSLLHIVDTHVVAFIAHVHEETAESIADWFRSRLMSVRGVGVSDLQLG